VTEWCAACELVARCGQGFSFRHAFSFWSAFFLPLQTRERDCHYGTERLLKFFLRVEIIKVRLVQKVSNHECTGTAVCIYLQDIYTEPECSYSISITQNFVTVTPCLYRWKCLSHACEEISQQIFILIWYSLLLLYPANSVSKTLTVVQESHACTMHWNHLVEEPSYYSNIPNTWSWRKKAAIWCRATLLVLRL